jgi:phosphate transport system permease protein
LWRAVFQWSTVVGIIFLTLLLYNVSNQSFGYVALGKRVDPASLAVNGVAIEDLDQAVLVEILKANISSGLLRQFERERPLTEYSRDEIYALIIEKVVSLEVVQTWTLTDSLLHAGEIRAQVAEEYPQAELRFRSWITPNFLRVPQSSNPLVAGVRTALLGSLWTIAITLLVAFPVGVGAAIYLEEYAAQNRLNRIIQTNINNLAGVPSIIYGMLGLAIFVRNLDRITSGAAFGLTDPTTANGRTILSAGLTLALLVLPLIIINAQEAIRAVPASLRHASYGVGATKWQTVWHHVLPGAMPGILTGTILSISRAIGETAPLVVVGAATYITFDPNGPFSKFTTLPIQIYQWTSRPQAEFRNLAAAAIMALLGLLLTLNALAIMLRNHFRRTGGNL